MEIEDHEKVLVQQSTSDLYKYKVIKVIGSGMLVMHSDIQQLYYIKVIHKTSKFSLDKLVLPRNVPYMVNLYNYYDSENALFLVLQYCSGTTFYDYIKQRTNRQLFMIGLNSDSVFQDDKLSSQKCEDSDSDSEDSYSLLIQEYTLCRALKKENGDTLCGIQNGDEVQLPKRELPDQVDELVKPSFERLKKSSRRSSEMSEWSSFDDLEFNENAVLPTEDVIRWASQLLLALERLHLLGVICCDLQTKNILINESGDLVLTYMCNVIEKYDVAFNENEDLVLAPEMYSFNPITEAVDWWSYGAILYEWLVGTPLKSVHPKGFSTCTYLKIPKYVSMEGRSLLKQLLICEMHERLGCGINGADDIKSHPFFNSVIWEHLATK